MKHLYRRIIAAGMTLLGVTVILNGSIAVEYITHTFNMPTFDNILGALLIVCGVLSLWRPQMATYAVLSLPGLVYLSAQIFYAASTGIGFSGAVITATLYGIWISEALSEKD